MIWAASAQAIMITLGYLSAACAAGVFAAAAIVKLGTVPPTAFGEASQFAMISTSTVLTALVGGFWPAAIAVAITEGFRLRGIVSHVLAGCVVGLLAALPVRAFVASGGQLPDVSSRLVQLCIASGAVAGFIYWIIAGRHAGKWQRYRLFEENRR